MARAAIEIPVNGAIGIRAASLRDFQRDTADRIIVPTALEGHRLVTADQGVLEWSGQCGGWTRSARNTRGRGWASPSGR